MNRNQITVNNDPNALNNLEDTAQQFEDLNKVVNNLITEAETKEPKLLIRKKIICFKEKTSFLKRNKRCCF